MEYKRIISVTGMPGLFELVASKNDGAIVKNLEDGTTKFVSSRGHNFSHLESIEVYTHHGNVNLIDVFKAMQDSNEVLPSDKDTAAVKSYFDNVYPTMDEDRVYASDRKKMIKWYSTLTTAGVELKSGGEESGEGETAEPATETESITPVTETESDAAVPSPS